MAAVGRRHEDAEATGQGRDENRFEAAEPGPTSETADDQEARPATGDTAAAAGGAGDAETGRAATTSSAASDHATGRRAGGDGIG